MQVGHRELVEDLDPEQIQQSQPQDLDTVYLATSAQVALSLFNMHGASFDISEILALTLALLGALVARSCNTSLQLLWLLFQAVQILIYTSFLMVLLNINFQLTLFVQELEGVRMFLDILNLAIFVGLRCTSLWGMFQLRVSLREWVANNNGRKYHSKTSA